MARCAIRRSRVCAKTRKRPTSCASERRRSKQTIRTPSRRLANGRQPARRLAREDRGLRRRDVGPIDTIAGVKLSHPDKPLFPEAKLVKRDLALYYERDRRLDPAASSRPPAGAGALPRRLEQAVLFPEARRQERERRGHARRGAGGQGHGHLFRRQFPCRRWSRWCSGASSSCIRGDRGRRSSIVPIV